MECLVLKRALSTQKPQYSIFEKICEWNISRLQERAIKNATLENWDLHVCHLHVLLLELVRMRSRIQWSKEDKSFCAAKQSLCLGPCLCLSGLLTICLRTPYDMQDLSSLSNFVIDLCAISNVVFSVDDMLKIVLHVSSC